MRRKAFKLKTSRHAVHQFVCIPANPFHQLMQPSIPLIYFALAIISLYYYEKVNID
jgi:hypothetical protein